MSLQDDLMRFEGRFSSRLVTAFAPLVESSDPAIRLRAAEDELRFLSSALDIAVGSAPEVNLLDMVTLVALGRDAMATRWSVATCGDAARGVAEAFQASLDDIEEVARSVISDDVEAQLMQLIRDWQRENPEQEDVTSVRLSALGEHRGTSSGLAKGASGLFSMVRGAARTADTAVLLGERALYAAQRIPFIVRTHARIGGSELFADLFRNVEHLDLPRLLTTARSLGGRVEGTMNRLFFKAFLMCGGIALVTMTSWLVARVAHHRLTGSRWRLRQA